MPAAQHSRLFLDPGVFVWRDPQFGLCDVALLVFVCGHYNRSAPLPCGVACGLELSSSCRFTSGGRPAYLQIFRQLSSRPQLNVPPYGLLTVNRGSLSVILLTFGEAVPLGSGAPLPECAPQSGASDTAALLSLRALFRASACNLTASGGLSPDPPPEAFTAPFNECYLQLSSCCVGPHYHVLSPAARSACATLMHPIT